MDVLAYIGFPVGLSAPWLDSWRSRWVLSDWSEIFYQVLASVRGRFWKGICCEEREERSMWWSTEMENFSSSPELFDDLSK
jgi:hypothetical protein